MLQNVLADYLNHLTKERDFDLPFMALLEGMGFTDIHYTHGPVEFGKDFIAKRVENNKPIQFAFQLKCGDINQKTWRDGIQGQMLESVLATLSHPNFDSFLPCKSVLVTTGRINGNVALLLDDFNKNTILRMPGRLSIDLWDEKFLISNLAKHGVEGVHRATAEGYAAYGRFFSIYGQVIESRLTNKEVEQFSRTWNDSNLLPRQKSTTAVIEAHLLATRSKLQGDIYTAILFHLGALRALMSALHTDNNNEMRSFFLELCAQVRKQIAEAAMLYVAEVEKEFTANSQGILGLIPGPASIVTYPVQCDRVLEVASLAYFAHEDVSLRKHALSFLQQFVSQEPGCAHIISNRYAVSLVISVLALHHGSETHTAKELLHRATVWLCDRYESGEGLAGVEADADEEVNALLGYPFEAIHKRTFHTSFAATALCDLAAYIGDATLYANIVNDFKAVGIVFQYWQPQDTAGQFVIDGEDIVQYPNIEFQDALSPQDALTYAEHIADEPDVFRLSDEVGVFGYLAIMLLLRDRYFPKLWRKL